MAIKKFEIKSDILKRRNNLKKNENFLACIFVYFYYYIEKNFDNIINSNIFNQIINLNFEKEINIAKITLIMFTVFLMS